MTAGFVKAEMLSGKDTAVGRFFSGRRKARERAFYTGENLRRNAQLEMISFEKGNEYLCRCRTDDSVSTWVGWVGTCPADLRKPIRISHCFGVTVGIGSPNGGYGPASPCLPAQLGCGNCCRWYSL